MCDHIYIHPVPFLMLSPTDHLTYYHFFSTMTPAAATGSSCQESACTAGSEMELVAEKKKRGPLVPEEGLRLSI